LLTDWNAATTLITDVAPQGALKTALDRGGAKVIVASGN
jgi:hypothetical protein